MKKISLLTFILCVVITANAQTVNLSLEKYGARADGIVLSDGVISAGSNVLTSNSAAFATQDIGKKVYVAGAAASGNTLIGNIASISSNHSAVLSTNAANSVTNAGITYGTDCTNAFVQFNKEARAAKNVILNMKPGTYLTSFNNWIAGIKNLTVNGKGCNIICTHGATDPLNSPNANCGLYMPSCFDNVDNNYYTNKYISNTSFGYKIQSALALSTKIKTSDPQDASNFQTGDWVLIYGLHHEDFGGYPPDPRYFEYVKIKRVDKSTGTIYLDRNLVNSYDAGWPDGLLKGGVGAPRIISLDRDNFTIVENLELNNMTFLPFNGWTGKYAVNIRNGRIAVYGFINAKISNVKAPAAYVGQGKNLLISSTIITYFIEPDKVLDSTVIENSTIAGMANAGGLNILRLTNNTFKDSFNASPRILYVDGNTFDCDGTTSQSLASIGFNKGTDSVIIGSNTWVCSKPTRHALFSPSRSVNLNVINVINDNTITIPYAAFVSDKDSRQVVPNSVGYTPDGNKLTVKRVYQYDANNIAISGNFTKPPKIGDRFIFSLVPNLKVTGKQTKTGQYANQYQLFQNMDKTTKLTYRSELFKN